MFLGLLFKNQPWAETRVTPFHVRWSDDSRVHTTLHYRRHIVLVQYIYDTYYIHCAYVYGSHHLPCVYITSSCWLSGRGQRRFIYVTQSCNLTFTRIRKNNVCICLKPPKSICYKFVITINITLWTFSVFKFSWSD